MTDAVSTVSTTTQIPLGVSAPAPSDRPKARGKVALLEEHLVTAQRLAEALSTRIATLEAENAELKAALQAAETCSVVVTCSKRTIEVAAVTNSNPEGVALLERLDNGLRQNEAKLHAQGTGFAIVNDVPVNQLFHSPL